MSLFRSALIVSCLTLATITGMGESSIAQKSAKKAKASDYKAPVCSSIPKVGTSFVNTYYLLDSAGKYVPGNVEDPKIPDDSQYVVLSGEMIDGHKNSIAFTNKFHEDTTYMSYDANGDVWLKAKRRGDKWERLPFGLQPGKILKTKELLDTGHVMGSNYGILTHSETQVLGMDTVNVLGKTYDCIKMQIVVYTRYDPKHHKGLEDQHYANAMNYWYIPEIGYFGRINFGWGGSYFLNQELKSYRPL